MWQLLILVSVILLIFLITRINTKSKRILDNPDEGVGFVKCESCGINVPETQAVKIEGNWYCSKEHMN